MAGVGSPKFTSENNPRKGGKPGRVTKRTMLRKNAELLATAKGIDPKLFMLGLVGDEEAPMDLRLVAAKEVAPYVHAKKPTQLTGADGAPLVPAQISITFTKADGP